MDYKKCLPHILDNIAVERRSCFGKYIILNFIIDQSLSDSRRVH